MCSRWKTFWGSFQSLEQYSQQCLLPGKVNWSWKEIETLNNLLYLWLLCFKVRFQVTLHWRSYRSLHHLFVRHFISENSYNFALIYFSKKWQHSAFVRGDVISEAEIICLQTHNFNHKTHQHILALDPKHAFAFKWRRGPNIVGTSPYFSKPRKVQWSMSI